MVRESLHFGFVCIRPPLFSVSTEVVRVSSHPEMTSQLVSIIKSYSSSKRKLYRWGCSLFNSTQFFSSIEQRLEPPFFPLGRCSKSLTPLCSRAVPTHLALAVCWDHNQRPVRRLVSLLQALWPHLHSLSFSLVHCFVVLFCIVFLDSVAWCAVESNSLGARRARCLRTKWTLWGNSHLEYFMDGLSETVEVVVY